MTSDRTEQICDILGSLVAFDTVSHRSNNALIDWIAARLDASGVVYRRIPDPVLDKAAIWATIGPADQPGYVLSAHTDVVPVDGQRWSSNPFALSRRGSRLFGRGTTDMKGFLAVCLALVPRMQAARLATPIHLAISYDEEVGCTGVRTMLAELARAPVKPLGCIVGEPTSMAVVIGHKGKCGVRATVRGLGCHSALAPKGVNAVEWAAELILAIRDKARVLAATGPRDQLYEVAFSTGLSTMVVGGMATNIVPERCTVEFEFRAIGPWDSAAIAGEIIAGPGAELARRLAGMATGCGIDFDIVLSYPGLDTAASHPLVTLAKQLAGRNEHGKVAFGTEAGLFTSMAGIPAVVLGPGNIEQAHIADEFIEIGQLEACAAMIEQLIRHCAA